MRRRLVTRLSRAARRLRDPRGFGLIELTIALSMLAVALVALSAVFVAGNTVFRRAGQQDAAAVLADRMLERYRAIDWSDIALSSQLVSATDSTYQSDPALSGSLSNDITETNGASAAKSCTGTDENALPLTCIPARAIPDTTASHPEVAPDHKSYRVDTYVTWGCPDGSTPDPTTGCGGSLFSRVKVVTIVVRDASNASLPVVYRTSTSFDRLGGGSMPAVNVTPTGTGTTTTGATTTAPGGAPAAPASVTLADGGGQGNAYVDKANVNSINIDVGLSSTSLATDLVFLSIDDGSGVYTVKAQSNGTNGVGVVHFTGLNLQPLADGPLTIAAYTENSNGDSATTSETITKDTVSPDAPTSVALQNGAIDGTWIDKTNVSTVHASVGLDANSLSTDTVTVVFSDGSHTASGTVAGSAGAGTVTTGSIDTSSLDDGEDTITATATVQDLAGNSSTAVTSPVYSKDAHSPTITPSCPVSGGSYKLSGNGSNSWAGTCSSELSGTVTDTGSGLDTITVSVQEGTGTNACWNGSAFSASCPDALTPSLTGSTWSIPLAASSLTKGSTYTVVIVATDKIGQSRTTTFSFTAS